MGYTSPSARSSPAAAAGRAAPRQPAGNSGSASAAECIRDGENRAQPARARTPAHRAGRGAVIEAAAGAAARPAAVRRGQGAEQGGRAWHEGSSDSTRARSSACRARPTLNGSNARACERYAPRPAPRAPRPAPRAPRPAPRAPRAPRRPAAAGSARAARSCQQGARTGPASRRRAATPSERAPPPPPRRGRSATPAPRGRRVPARTLPSASHAARAPLARRQAHLGVAGRASGSLEPRQRKERMDTRRVGGDRAGEQLPSRARVTSPLRHNAEVVQCRDARGIPARASDAERVRLCIAAGRR